MKTYTEIIRATRDRHNYLTDRKFLGEITEKQNAELKQVNHLLNASEDKYYEPIKMKLANLTILTLEEQVAQMRAAAEKAVELLDYYVANYQCTSPNTVREIIERLKRSLI